MPNLVNLDRVTKAYPSVALFDQVSLGLDEADRVGVVGLNGAGKSTLLRLLTLAEQPDEGRVVLRRDLRVRCLPQALDLPARASVRDVVIGSAWLPAGFAAEHEWAGDAGVRAVLAGLGLPDLGLDALVGPMSGGERRRVALAALLVRPADLLVLDEPTNHLDVTGVGWLAEHLLRRRGALVVVTHDRWFLDAVCTTTWEVADGTVRAYEGGYAAWTLARVERQRREAAAEARRSNLLRKEIAWLRRGPPARTSKPKFRIEAANALIADVPPARDAVSLRRLATSRLGKQVFELDAVTLRAGPDPDRTDPSGPDPDGTDPSGPDPGGARTGGEPGGRVLLDQVTFQVGPGDRVAILGPNGAGKTTLLRVLLGARSPDGGQVRRGATVRAAYLSQELEDLPGHLRLLEAVEEVAHQVRLGHDRPRWLHDAGRAGPMGTELSAAQLAEVFGFSRARTWAQVADLSGGERRRLQLLRLLAAEPNVLLLDEPTNDLDTDTLAALEDLLDTWPGTLIVASHDRYLVERVCDVTLAMLGDGRLRHLPGGVEEYLAAATAAEPVPAPVVAAAPPVLGTAGPAALSTAGELREAKKELARLERRIAKLERREADLHEQLATHATDYERVVALDAELRAVRDERAATEESWLMLADRVET